MDGWTEPTEKAHIEAQQAADLLLKITEYGTKAVYRSGVSTDWVNNWLTALGAKPVASPTANEYRMNVPITGLLGITIHANTRTEAAQQFNKRVAELGGKVNDCHTRGYNVYDIELNPAAGGVKFYSGPEDAATDTAEAPMFSLQELKNGIRRMLKEGVTAQGWHYQHAQRALAEMNIDILPGRLYRKVEVPVSGTATVTVTAFEGDDEDDVLDYARHAVSGDRLISVKAEEVGEAQMVVEPDEVSGSF